MAARTFVQLPRNIIYALVDPRIGKPRYVGKSTSGFERPSAHKYRIAQTDRSHRANWIRSLKSDNVAYFIVVLETFADDADDATLDRAECKWIAFGWVEGWDLTNATIGGGGVRGWRHREETLQQMSQASLRHWADLGYRARHSASLMGREFSETHRENIATSRRGRAMLPQVAEALRLANAGRVRAQSDEERAQRRVAMRGNTFGRGYRHTEEARAKISAARAGKSTRSKQGRPALRINLLPGSRP